MLVTRVGVLFGQYVPPIFGAVVAQELDWPVLNWHGGSSSLSYGIISDGSEEFAVKPIRLVASPGPGGSSLPTKRQQRLLSHE